MSNLLSEVHPELIAEWSDKNLPLTPDKVTFGSNKIMWWKGSCGHEWQTSIKARSNGEGCPICSGARAVEGINDLTTLRPELAKEWSKKNKDLQPTMVTIGSSKKVIWKGKCGHEWIATVKSRAISKTGCPYCSHNSILEGFNDLASQKPDLAEEWSKKNYPLMPDMVTVFANRKVWWKCKECGNEWNTLISTRSGGSKCPYCSGLILLKGFNDLSTTYPQIASEWSERNLPLEADMVNAKSRKDVIIIERPHLGSEDFAYYQEEIPGAMFMLGCKNEDCETGSLHSSVLNIDEEALMYGIKIYTNIALGLNK